MARLSQFGEASGHDREILIVVWKEIRLFAIEARFVVRTYDHPKHDVITRSRRMQGTYRITGFQLLVGAISEADAFPLLDVISTVDRHPEATCTSFQPALNLVPEQPCAR